MNELNTRRATKADFLAIKDLFLASVSALCRSDYSPEEIAVWTASIKDEARWRAKIREQAFFLAEKEGQLLGMASLAGQDYIDIMYVHPDAVGKGLASHLLLLVEARAREAGTKLLLSDVSKTARPFFEKKGFQVLRTNHIPRGDQVLINYRMEKRLQAFTEMPHA